MHDEFPHLPKKNRKNYNLIIFFRIASEHEDPDLVRSSNNLPNDDQIDTENICENKDLVMNFEEEVYNELENKLKEKHEMNEKIITDAIVAAANEEEDDEEKNPDEEAIHFVELNPNNLEKKFRSSFHTIIAPESNNVTYF